VLYGRTEIMYRNILPIDLLAAFGSANFTIYVFSFHDPIGLCRCKPTQALTICQAHRIPPPKALGNTPLWLNYSFQLLENVITSLTIFFGHWDCIKFNKLRYNKLIINSRHHLINRCLSVRPIFRKNYL